jgi:hypothetical protein
MDGRTQGNCATVRLLVLIVGFCVLADLAPAVAAPALAELKAAAEAGDAQAQDRLAEAYRRQFDHTNATFWYRKAAAQGVANSQFQLAQTLIYEASTSWVKVDSKPARAAEGFELLKCAAQQGHTRAQLHLGRLHQEGRLVSQDYVEAYKWFAIAGRSGPLDAPAMEGRMYRDRLILKMSQAEIAEGEARARCFTPGTAPSRATAPGHISLLRLQGISGPRERRLALINGRTFEAGEGGSVKLGDSLVYLTCLSVTTNGAHVVLPETGTKVFLPLGKAPVVENPPVQEHPPAKVQPAPSVQPQPMRKPPAARPPVSAPPAHPKAPDPFPQTKRTLRMLAWIPAMGAIVVSLAILGLGLVVPLLRRGTKRPAPRTATPPQLQPPILNSPKSVPRTIELTPPLAVRGHPPVLRSGTRTP